MSKNIEIEDIKSKVMQDTYESNSRFIMKSSESSFISCNFNKVDRLNFHREIGKGVFDKRSDQRQNDTPNRAMPPDKLDNILILQQQFLDSQILLFHLQENEGRKRESIQR